MKKYGLELRIIREMENKFEPSHKLVLTNPSQLEFKWFEIHGNIEKVAKEQENLWKRYNPKLREMINSFSKFIEGGAFLEEITDILEINYSNARILRKSTIDEYNLLELAEAKGKRISGKWHSLPIELIAYMLSYYTPIIEGWKTSYDIATDNEVSTSTVNNICRNPQIEVIKRLGKGYVSPIGEKVVVGSLQRKVRRYIVRKGDIDYHSIVYASREAARLRGFIEGTEAFEKEAEVLYKKILYLLSNCLVVKSEEIGRSPYVDRKNLELLCDIVSLQEASKITNLPENEIKLMVKSGELPPIPGKKGNFTLRSAVLELKETKEGKKEAGEYQSLLEINQSLKTSLELTTQELKQAQSEISKLNTELSAAHEERNIQTREYTKLKTEANSLRTETKAQKRIIEQNQKSIAALESQVNNLIIEKQEQRVGYEQEEANLKGRYNKLETTIDSLDKEIAQQKGTIAQLQSEKATLAAQVTAFQERVSIEEIANKTIADLTKQIADLTKESQDYVTREKGLKTKYAQLEARLELTTQKLGQAQSKIKELQTRVADYQAEETEGKPTLSDSLIKELTREKAQLTEQLKTSQELYDEQTIVLKKSDDELTKLRNRYREEERDYLTKLWRAASAFDDALSQGKIPEKNKDMDELLSYLMKATHFQGIEVLSLSRYAPALEAKATTTYELYAIRGWIEKYLTNREVKYAKNIAPFIFQLTENLKERIS